MGSAPSFRPQRRGTRCGEPESRGDGARRLNPWVPGSRCASPGMTETRTCILGLNALYTPIASARRAALARSSYCAGAGRTSVERLRHRRGDTAEPAPGSTRFGETSGVTAVRDLATSRPARRRRARRGRKTSGVGSWRKTSAGDAADAVIFPTLAVARRHARQRPRPLPSKGGPHDASLRRHSARGRWRLHAVLQA